MALISVILFRSDMAGPTANNVLLVLAQHTEVVVATAEKNACHITDAEGAGTKQKFARLDLMARRVDQCTPSQLRAGHYERATTSEAKRERFAVGA